MKLKYKNLVFSGGGVLGISYIGAIDYLYKINLMPSFINVAGSSAGAITACMASFNLPFNELLKLVNTLDYKKVPLKDDKKNTGRTMPTAIIEQFGDALDNIDCISRLIKSFGWYSSDYLYSWLQKAIAAQFIAESKSPPYTFSDFQDTSLHHSNKPFKNLYIIGTDISKASSIVFSYETTPDMEVAEAVRISSAVPLLFESIKSSCSTISSEPKNIYCDGGMLYNYPINLFDKTYQLNETLGFYFKPYYKPALINNLVDYISSTLSCTGSLQNELFLTDSKNISRSICIQTSDISAFDFNISTNDSTYEFLYTQGYRAAETYFSILNS